MVYIGVYTKGHNHYKGHIRFTTIVIGTIWVFGRDTTVFMGVNKIRPLGITFGVYIWSSESFGLHIVVADRSGDGRMYIVMMN